MNYLHTAAAILALPNPSTPHQAGQLDEIRHLTRELCNDRRHADRQPGGEDLVQYIDSWINTLHIRASRLAGAMTQPVQPVAMLKPAFGQWAADSSTI